MAIPATPFSEGIDLHAHTTESDGSLTPTELIDQATRLGLRAIAVTDHDTLAGLSEAREAALGKIEFVPGVELAVEDETGRFHMLGYLFDQEDARLSETLAELRLKRAARNRKIMANAEELGLPFTWDDVMAQVKDGGDVVARPHVAGAMMKKGIVGSVREAFDNWLAPGKPLYFAKGGLTPRDAIALLHNAGGLAVMAHPGLSKWKDPTDLAPYLADLKEQGLDGLEVYYSQHATEQIEAYAEIADHLGMVKTGGSDFHGIPKPHVPLGISMNEGPAPYSSLEDLKKRILPRTAG